MPRGERTRFILSSYSAEQRHDGWYFGHPFAAAGDYRGPYSSLASLTLVVARELRREIERRARPLRSPPT